MKKSKKEVMRKLKLRDLNSEFNEQMENKLNPVKLKNIKITHAQTTSVNKK